MKLSLLLASLLLACTAPVITHAQYYHNNDKEKNNDLIFSEGMVTLEQLKGWNGNSGVSGYISQPYTFSGAVFATYRHSFTRRFQAGITVGIDNESGDLSYGNPEHNVTGFEGTSGFYSVHSFTFALEAVLAYIRTPRFMFYGYTGAGYTLFRENYQFFTHGYHPAPVTLPTNPYEYRHSYFNAQVSPLCIRFGGRIAGIVETGFGYKGFISLGLDARF